MPKVKFLWSAIAFLIALGLAAALYAADENTPGQKPGGEPPQKKREELKNLGPEERRAKWREDREKRETWTPEQREAKRKELRERFDKRLTELQKKKTDATLTEQEAKQLERMEQMKKRFQQFGRSGGPPPKRPNVDKPSAPEKSPAAR